MNRVYFDCGRRALLQSREDSELLRAVNERFSAGNDDLLRKLETREERESELRAELAGMAQYIRAQEADRIAAEIRRSEGTPVHIHTPVPLGPEDGVKLGFAVLQKCEDVPGDLLLMLYHEAARTVLLFSKGAIACGALVKKHAPAFGGRGGGRPDNARALFADRASAEQFLRAVRDSLS